MLETAEGFGVALPPSPAAVYSMATVVLLYMEVLALKFFPAGKFNQKDSAGINAGENSSHTRTFGSLWERGARVHQDPLQRKWPDHVPSLTAPKLV